jgi:hypothetical protein
LSRPNTSQGVPYLSLQTATPDYPLSSTPRVLPSPFGSYTGRDNYFDAQQSSAALSKLPGLSYSVRRLFSRDAVPTDAKNPVPVGDPSIGPAIDAFGSPRTFTPHLGQLPPRFRWLLLAHCALFRTHDLQERRRRCIWKCRHSLAPSHDLDFLMNARRAWPKHRRSTPTHLRRRPHTTPPTRLLRTLQRPHTIIQIRDQRALTRMLITCEPPSFSNF